MGAVASAEKLQETGKRGRGHSMCPTQSGYPSCSGSKSLSQLRRVQCLGPGLGVPVCQSTPAAPRAAICQPGKWAPWGSMHTGAPGHVSAASSAPSHLLPGRPIRDVFPVGPSLGRGWGWVTDSDGALGRAGKLAL